MLQCGFGLLRRPFPPNPSVSIVSHRPADMNDAEPLSPDAYRFLDRQGLDLVAVFDSGWLIRSIGQGLEGCDPVRWPTLILLGNSGPALWRLLRGRVATEPHAFDRHSTDTAGTLVRDYLGDAPFMLLYPGATPLALQRLGEAAGWGRPSLLGLSIHPRHGTWFAYRAALLVGRRLPASAPPALPLADPCAICADQPCRRACPVSAPRTVGSFDLDACVGQRLAPASPCAGRCAARMACPVGSDFRYDDDQIAYHAGRSLDSLRRWARHPPRELL
jgi:hypothetical protein